MGESIKNDLINKYPVAKASDIQEQLESEVNSWEESVHRKLKLENPFLRIKRNMQNQISVLKAERIHRRITSR
jgi:hypothetical protein